MFGKLRQSFYQSVGRLIEHHGTTLLGQCLQAGHPSFLLWKETFKTEPVSYTHLDVYKRQDQNIEDFASKPSTGWTDWKDLLFRNGSHQNYQLSVSGGNDRTKFLSLIHISNEDSGGSDRSQYAPLSTIMGGIKIQF